MLRRAWYCAIGSWGSTNAGLAMHTGLAGHTTIHPFPLACFLNMLLSPLGFPARSVERPGRPLALNLKILNEAKSQYPLHHRSSRLSERDTRRGTGPPPPGEGRAGRVAGWSADGDVVVPGVGRVTAAVVVPAGQGDRVGVPCDDARADLLPPGGGHAGPGQNRGGLVGGVVLQRGGRPVVVHGVG